MTSLLDILRREEEAVKNLKEARREEIHITSLSRTKAAPESTFKKWKEETIEMRRKASAEYLLVRQELRQYLAELNANEDDIYL